MTATEIVLVVALLVAALVGCPASYYVGRMIRQGKLNAAYNPRLGRRVCGCRQASGGAFWEA
jgi:hypothetical protein